MTLTERGVAQPHIGLARLLSGSRPTLDGACTLRLVDYAEEILSSGFPALRSLSPRALRFQLDSYLRNVVDRDVPEQGLSVRKPESMLAWLRACASATSTTASYTQILDATRPGQGEKPAGGTAISYRDVLSRLWHSDPVRPGCQPEAR